MRRLLILGAGTMQIPAFRAAMELGVEVVTIDPSPSAPALPMAHASFCHDLGDLDACLKVARDQAVTGVMTLAADYPIPAVAELCEKLDLAGPGKKAVRAATHKAEMHRSLAAAGVPVPRTIPAATADEANAAVRALGGKTILKPADSSGGRGVTSFDPTPHPDEVGKAFDRAIGFGRSGEVVVAELVEGPEYSVESLTWGGRTTVVAVTEKLTTGPPYHVEIGHSQPPRLEYADIARLGKVAAAGISALGIDDAPGHTEIKVGPEGPRVIEVAARLGGGYITSTLVPLSCGVDLVRAAVQLALGEEPDLRERPGGTRGAAVRFLAPPPGRIRAIHGLEQARKSAGVRHLVLHMAVGQWVPRLMNGTERTGYVICDGVEAETAIRNAERARDLVHIETELNPT